MSTYLSKRLVPLAHRALRYSSDFDYFPVLLPP